MATNLRKAPGMREKQPEVWELVVEAGIDPVTGKRRQVSRTFRGTMRDAKKARALLLTEVEKGRHTGTAATVDQLFDDFLVELERKGRSPNTIHAYRRTYNRNIKATLGNVPVTKVTTKMLTDLYGAHQRRGLKPRSVYQIHATLSSMFTQACRALVVYGAPDALVGYMYNADLATHESPPVYAGPSEELVGYFVPNVGFVPEDVFDAPGFDPRAEEFRRNGEEAVNERERLESEGGW